MDDYETVWRRHFDNEEQAIFIPYSHRDQEVKKLCDQLTLEHQQFDDFIEQMKSGHYEGLLDFGKLLKSHTRMEERELFPLISELLSETELDNIYQIIKNTVD